MTGSPTENKSEEDSSSSEESSGSNWTAPPVKAPSTQSTTGVAILLGGITKPPVKMPSVPNPYINTRVGISKFVVPKASIPHRSPTQRAWTRTTPALSTTPVITKDKGAASREINGGDRNHIVREKSGRIYNARHRSRQRQGPTSRDTSSHSVT